MKKHISDGVMSQVRKLEHEAADGMLSSSWYGFHLHIVCVAAANLLLSAQTMAEKTLAAVPEWNRPLERSK